MLYVLRYIDQGSTLLLFLVYLISNLCFCGLGSQGNMALINFFNVFHVHFLKIYASPHFTWIWVDKHFAFSIFITIRTKTAYPLEPRKGISGSICQSAAYLGYLHRWYGFCNIMRYTLRRTQRQPMNPRLWECGRISLASTNCTYLSLLSL